MSKVNPEILEYIRERIIPQYEGFDPAHRTDHVNSVIQAALEMSRHYDVDIDVIAMAAACHDLGLSEDRKTHHLVSGRIIRDNADLHRWFTGEQIETIAQAAEDHRASSDHEPRSIYGRIIAEADRQIVPETVIRRTVQFGLEHYPELDIEGHWQRTLEHLHEKYAEGGYLKLWIPESANAGELERLRKLIRDEAGLRRIFEEIYNKETNNWIDMTNKNLLAATAALALISCNSNEPSKYAQDTFKAEDGTEITFTYYGHASIAIEALGKHIYVDPVGEGIDWAGEPEADLVLITHDHYDHLDTNAVKILTGKADGYTKLAVGTTIEPFDKIAVEAVPAYNISPEQLDFHPKERGDAGYIITITGKRIYVSGDTEDNEDVLALSDIDIAFICCNKPFTMTVEQCARVVKAIHPGVFIPYHYGGTDIPTDIDALQDSLKDVTEVLIRPLM